MLIKVLYCILIPLIKGSPFDGMADMYLEWDESLLFIYYEQKFDLKSSPQNIFQNPDCFAFQISSDYAFTTSSCFMNLEGISKMLENHETHERIEQRILSGNDMKPSIEKFHVVQVFALEFVTGSIRKKEFGKWKFREVEKMILHFRIKKILMNPDFGRKSLHSI